MVLVVPFKITESAILKRIKSVIKAWLYIIYNYII